jgi:hypothetical protein
MGFARKGGRHAIVFHVVVTITSHQRMLRIPKGTERGAALGAWLAAGCYSRMEELDGWCPAEHLDAVASPLTLESLVAVGLFERSDRDGVPGYVVCKYADTNDTKEEINARLAGDRRRKGLSRSGVCPDGIRTEPERNPPEVTSILGVGEGVGEVSASERESEERVPLPADRPPLTVVPGPTRARNPTDAGVGHIESTLWADGCRLAGRPVSDPDRFAREVIARVANVQGPMLRGQQMADWIRESSRSYAVASVGHEDFWPLTVARWKAWTESGSKPIQAAGPRKAVMQATPPDAPWLRGLT